MPFDKIDIDSIDDERRKSIAKSIRPVSIDGVLSSRLDSLNTNPMIISIFEFNASSTATKPQGRWLLAAAIVRQHCQA